MKKVLSFLMITLFFGTTYGWAGQTEMVTNTANSGAGSLSEAITNVDEGGTITVDPSLSGQTIILTVTLTISKSLTIDGNGLNVSGGGTNRQLSVSDGTVIINRMNFINGYYSSGSGGAITNSTTLKLNSCLFDNNYTNTTSTAARHGGAISSSGTLTLNACIFSNNRTAGTGTGDSNGGAIHNNRGILYANGCTFYHNTSKSYGGAIYNYYLSSAGTSYLTGCLFYGNTATNATAKIIYNNATTGNRVSSNGYNVYDNTSSNFTFNGIGDTSVTEEFFSPTSFRWLPDLAAAKIITSLPSGYPDTDFYGDPITAPAYPGAVQRPLVSPITWKSDAASNKWDNAANWVENLVPEVYTDVVIPQSSTCPVLESAKTYAAKDITFEAGAELGRQDKLTSTTAHVNYDLKKAHRYYQLAIPVDGITSGDFFLDNDPAVYMKEYYLNGASAAWKPISNLDKSLPLGSGFGLRVEEDAVITISGALANGNVTEDLLWGEDSKYGSSKFALAGNPFMTSINFATLAGENTNVITPNYLIWNDTKAYTGYTPDGTWGTVDGVIDVVDAGYGKIAPLQSFFVEQGSTATDQLLFNIATLGATGTATLKAASTEPANKLSIVASNAAGSVRTFIANREYGQSTVSTRDARKLFSTASNIPDIYTLKDSEDGQVALGANIINTNNITVPLGLSTNYTGTIQLTFSGMDSYEGAKITFIDQVEGESINLSGLDSFVYPFENTPAGADVNDRFRIQFAPSTPTGIAPPDDVQNIVYSSKGVIYATSSDQIRQIYVYNIQGKLIYADSQINASSYNVGIALPEVCVVKLVTVKGVKTVKLINK